MKPGATLGLSHGFLLGVMQNDGVDFRPDVNVVLNAPKACAHGHKRDPRLKSFVHCIAQDGSWTGRLLKVQGRAHAALGVTVCAPSQKGPSIA